MNEIDLLIEDYERKLKMAQSMIDLNKMSSARIIAKASCYKSFIYELNILKNKMNNYVFENKN